MKHSLRCILLAMLLQLLAGCEKPDEPVRIGLLVWPPYELAYLARDRGYFSAMDVELVNFRTPAELVRSYRFGLIDGMFVTSQFALTDDQSMDGSHIIYVINFSDGGDALLAQPDIESADQLAGRRVGMEAGPLGAYTLVRALHRTELGREDVEIVFIDTPYQREAFLNGSIDALATYEPTRSLLLKDGANELFNSHAIPLEIIDVLIVRDTVIAAKADKLARMLEGVDQAMLDFIAQPISNAEVMSKRQGLNSDEFLRAMNGVRLLSLEQNRALLGGSDPRLLRGLEQQVVVMQEADMLVGDPDIDRLIDDSIVRRTKTQ